MIILVPAVLGSCIAAVAQTTPAFDVASVKPGGSGDYIEVTRGGMIAHGARLASCIKWAWNLQDGQVSGATRAISDFLVSDRYDIDARTPGLVSEAQTRLMLQTLLAERFQLTFHKERREVQTFALLVDKGGPKFRESAASESRMEAKSKLNRSWTHTTMRQFTDTLSEAMQAPVLDQTGLTASYDFSIDLTPLLPQNGERPDISGMMVTALREQLGLRLASVRAPLDVVIVDRLEKPSSN